MKKAAKPKPARTRETIGPAGELILYQTEDGRTQVECRFDGGTIWLTQLQLASLFQTSVQNINLHILNVLEDGEATEATIKDYLIVRSERGRDVRRSVKHYNLDMILSVGYRVRSARGTAFRQWATARLSEYLVKGFVLDDERLKDPSPDRPDYFDEVLERIRDIRSAEKRIYLKVKDIFALAADYRPDASETLEFFRVIQNKLHWAATGKTAAELIAERADSTKANMGLSTWKGAKVRKADVTVAKNYLQASEITELNRIVTMYLDYAEDQARRRRVLYMKDWRERLDAFLQFNEREVLDNPGKVSKEIADHLAEDEYDKFHARRLAVESLADEQAFEIMARQLAETPSKPRKPTLR
jgi:hypothetical protein